MTSRGSHTNSCATGSVARAMHGPQRRYLHEPCVVSYRSPKVCASVTCLYLRKTFTVGAWCAIARLAEWLKCYHEEVMPIAASNCPRTRLQVRDVPSGTLVDVPRPGTAMNLTGAGPGHFRSIEDATAADLLAWRTALTVSPGFTLRPGLCG